MGAPFIYPPIALISGPVFFVVESTCIQPHGLAFHISSKTLRVTETLTSLSLLSAQCLMCLQLSLGQDIFPEIVGFLPIRNHLDAFLLIPQE